MDEESLEKKSSFGRNQGADQHVRAILRLAEDLMVPAAEIQKMYMDILDDLRKSATVKLFLPVLVSREVRERLRHR